MMKTSEKLNMTMLCDFYELTMGNGYFKNGYKDRIVIFDVFFRRVPDQGGFAIAAGLEQLIEYIEDLHFSDEDIEYLRGRNLFCEEFLEYLKDFRFTGDIYAVPEGTPVFPKEPLVVVKAPAIEAQLIETFTLLTVNHQSLIATKARSSRVSSLLSATPVVNAISCPPRKEESALLSTICSQRTILFIPCSPATSVIS